MENKDQNEEEQLIQEIINLQKAWNTGDAQAISRLFTEDSKRVGSFGEIANGRFEIEETFKMLLKRALPGSRLLMKGNIIKFLTTDLAIWQSSYEISSSDNQSHIDGYVVLIMKKENNKWMILEMHTKVFPLENQISI